MIKATMIGDDGRTTVLLGLSFRNLDNFREKPGDSYIRISGHEMNLPVDVLIFSGDTEAALTGMLATMIGPNTKVNIEPKQKN